VGRKIPMNTEGDDRAEIQVMSRASTPDHALRRTPHQRRFAGWFRAGKRGRQVDASGSGTEFRLSRLPAGCRMRGDC